SVGLAVEYHAPGVGTDGPAEDFHQRGFAGAVLADQGVNLATAQLQINAAQRVRRPEVLVDTSHRQADGVTHFFAYFGFWTVRFSWYSGSNFSRISGSSMFFFVTTNSPVDRSFAPALTS